MADGDLPKWEARADARPFSASNHVFRSMHSSLGQAKPFGQAGSKRAVFSIRLMSNRRRERFLAYFNAAPLRGSREKLMEKTGYTKGRVSQVLDGDEAWESRAARNMAERLDLPPDYFEYDHPGGRIDTGTPRTPANVEELTEDSELLRGQSPPPWPFERMPRKQFEALTEREKGAVEQAALDALRKIQADKASNDGPPGKPPSAPRTR